MAVLKSRQCKCGSELHSGSKQCRDCWMKDRQAESKKHACKCGKLKDRRAKLCLDCRNAERRAVEDAKTAAYMAKPPAERVQEDRKEQRARAEMHELRAKYDAALKTNEQLEAEREWLDQIRAGLDVTLKIEPKHGLGTSEATPVIVASDWHSEEIVKPSQTNGKNEFNAEICLKRVEKFFQSSLRLVRLLNQDVTISTVVLALLGDFITNDIHDELPENNSTTPIHAILNVQKQIAGGIEFLLEHSNYSFVIPCKVGNHSRTTRRVHHAQENGHSLEYYMYVTLASYFRHEPRVTFNIQDGYHTYLDVYDKTLRFHHGHDINYGGGVGGIFIPAFKAIHNWNDARRADLDIFGHFHQSKDGGSFLSNGSLIGYNAFAVAIKAVYEDPKQQLFLMDKQRGRTCAWPILLK